MTATWSIRRVPQDQVTAELLFGIAKRHRMLLENPNRMVDYYRAVCANCIVLEVMAGEGEKAADVIISEITDGDDAVVDLIVASKMFARYTDDGVTENKEPFEAISEMLSPVLDRLVEAHGLRRLTSGVPKSRSRTIAALEACGFEREGLQRRAVKFIGKEPEGRVMLGRLAKE